MTGKKRTPESVSYRGYVLQPKCQNCLYCVLNDEMDRECSKVDTPAFDWGGWCVLWKWDMEEAV